jgi:hypothetical protein
VRRLVLLSALLLAMLAVAGTAAGAVVELVPPGGAPRRLDLGALAGREDVHDAAYVLRDADGATHVLAVPAGFSLALLLHAAGIDASSFGYAQVDRADGGTTVLVHDQAVGDSADGPAVVYADAHGTHLLRPSAGPDDVNAPDLATVAEGPLTVALQRGEPFALQVRASTLHARVGQPVDFTAVVTAGGGDGLSFSWYFGDGSGIARGAHVRHRFPRAGSYLLNLTSEGGDAARAGNAIATVRVAAAPAAKRRGRAHGSAGAAVGVSGSGGGGGSGSGAESGAASATGASGATGTGGGTGASGAAGSGGGARTAAGGGGSTSPAPSHRTVAPPQRPAEPTAPAPRPPQGRLVSGTLLASVDPVPLPAAAAAAADGPVRKRPLHLPTAAWVALGLAALVAAGWALEARRTLPFWQP